MIKFTSNQICCLSSFAICDGELKDEFFCIWFPSVQNHQHFQFALPYWNWKTPLLFGGLLRATEPIAFVALLKELGTSKNMSTIIEGVVVSYTAHFRDSGHGDFLGLPSLKAASKSQGKFEEKIKKKCSYKRDFDGSPILPVGGHGGDVIIYADESKNTILKFHKKSRHVAKR